MELSKDYGAEAEAIMEEAVGKLVHLAQERYNETCECPEEHQLAPSAWVIVYEHVDMRPGGFMGSPRPEVIHSMSAAHSHASGMLRLAAKIVDHSVLFGG